MNGPIDSNRLKRDDFLRKAAEADIKAAEARDTYMRSSWEHIAAAYRDMAERMARNFHL
jgi:hypothetical protein